MHIVLARSAGGRPSSASTPNPSSRNFSRASQYGDFLGDNLFRRHPIELDANRAHHLLGISVNGFLDHARVLGELRLGTQRSELVYGEAIGFGLIGFELGTHVNTPGY